MQKPVELAAVMHGRVGHRIAPDQLVRPVHVHVVLVAEEAAAMLLGPARVFIFLAVLGRLPLPLRGRLAALDRLVLLGAASMRAFVLASRPSMWRCNVEVGATPRM